MCAFDEKKCARKAYIRPGLSAVNSFLSVPIWSVIVDVINYVQMSEAPVDCIQEKF